MMLWMANDRSYGSCTSRFVTFSLMDFAAETDQRNPGCARWNCAMPWRNCGRREPLEPDP